MVIMAVTASKAGPSNMPSHSFKQAPLAGAFSIFITLALATDAQAVEWRFTPYVSPAVTFTDNVNQSENNPQNAMILSVTPGFGLRSLGSRRIQASMNYSLTGVARFSDDNTTDLYHNLGAIGKAELIEDFLYVDGSANISQGLISLFGSQATATTNDTNRTTVGSYSLSPYIQKRLGTFATVQARYTNGGAIFGSNAAASNSVTNAFTASLTSGPRFNDLSWGLDYSIRQTNNNGTTPQSTFERANLTLGYALTRKFRVFGTYGEESNDFLTANNASGSSYSVGFGWAPSRRTNIEASIGERFFGRTYSLVGTHRTQASNWSVRYSEDVNDLSQMVVGDLKNRSIICQNPSSLPANATDPQKLAPPGCSLNLPYGTSIQSGVFIVKLLTADVSWTKGRLGLGLNGFDTKRIYQGVSGAEDHTQGVVGKVDYRLTPRTTANTSLAFTRNTATAVLLNGPARQDDIVTLSLGLNHQFGKDLSGALTFRHQQRDSNIVNADYIENSLTASANLRF
jgi:uncharacterized protein (PEP-CTERM system associated)